MSTFDQAREYLARVLPWPQPGESGYINIVWSFKSDRYDHPGWTGRAVSTVDEAISAVKFAVKGRGSLDVYACQSRQAEAQERLTSGGYKFLVPVRLQENALALKSLFLDIDADKVGKPGQVVKGYPTMAEAVTALGNFIKATGLPKPSMMVTSGGGLHVYWVLSRALTPQEWYPLACALIEATKRHGLKLDEAVTTDAARILRVPDTFNKKLETPRAVRVAGKPTDFDYSVERIEKALEPYKVDVTFLAQRHGGPTLAFEAPPTNTPPRAPLKGTSDLAAGVETAMPQLEVRACLDAIPNTTVDWNFWNSLGMRVYAATDGADYGLEEWQRWSDKNSASGVKESCADRWSVLHTSPPTRTGAGALVNEARAATGDPKWQARTFSAPVAQAPIAQAPGAAPAVAVPQPVVTGPVSSADLPSGYTRSAAGVVSLVGVNEDGTPNTTPISDYPITNGWLQKNPWVLNFDTVVERGKAAKISIENEFIGSTEMRKILQSQGFMLRIKATAAQEFFVAWVQKLQASKDAVTSEPFGWSSRNLGTHKVQGFVYGSKMYTPTGELSAAGADPVIAKQYSPTGDLQPWLDAVDMVTLQGRPDLDAIVASAFAAPLVRFSGQKGLQLSVYSQESGIGKSTAVSVAQAVWGDPRRVQGHTDTLNSTFGKMGQLKSLPIYWDEIKTEEDTKRFVELTFQLTKGVEKTRMKANTQLRESGSWQTLLVSASNDSLLDYIVGKTSTTTAGLLRVFEYEVMPGVKGQISVTDADRLVARLNENYGAAGNTYAKFLGENMVRIDKEYEDFANALGVEVNENKEERFWTVTIACLLMGAKYANELGLTDIDEAALKVFLVEKLAKMRGERASQPVDMRKAMNVSNSLAQFINAMRQRHTLFTNRIHVGAGKPPKGSIKVVQDASRLDGIYCHVGVDDKLLRISSTYLSEWLKAKDLSRKIFKDALAEKFGAKTINGRIGSGTVFAGATEYLLQIDLAGSPLADFIDEA